MLRSGTFRVQVPISVRTTGVNSNECIMDPTPKAAVKWLQVPLLPISPPFALMGRSPTLALRAVAHSAQTRSSGAIISSQLWHTAVSCPKRVFTAQQAQRTQSWPPTSTKARDLQHTVQVPRQVFYYPRKPVLLYSFLAS